MYDVTIKASARVLDQGERYIAIKFLQARIGLSLTAAVDLLRGLQAGGSTSYTEYVVQAAPEPFTVFSKKQPDPYEAHFARQDELHELCKRGADGDVEAAVAYCRAEMAGEVSHGAMG